jgi:flagellar biogenesis protein FliO
VKHGRKRGLAAALLVAGTVAAATAVAEPAAPLGPPVAPAPVVAAPVVPAPVPAVAVGAPPVAPAPAKPAPNWLRKDTKPAAKPSLGTQQGPSPLRVGGMLLLVSALGGVAYYARRRRQQAGTPAQVKQQLRVLGSTRIGPKASAVVVEVAGKRILLGVTEHAVNNLAWLDDEANQAVEEREASSVHTAPAVRPSAAPEAAGPSGFLKLLRSAVGSNAVAQVIPSDEVARATRDEVRLSHRGDSPARRERGAAFDDDLLEGQVMGLVKRRKEPS